MSLRHIIQIYTNKYVSVPYRYETLFCFQIRRVYLRNSVLTCLVVPLQSIFKYDEFGWNFNAFARYCLRRLILYFSMTGCSAPNCSNSSHHGFRVFRFPRDKIRLSLWKEQIFKKSIEPNATKSFTSRSHLCEVSFVFEYWNMA